MGVCGSYTSDLGCKRSLRLDRVITANVPRLVLWNAAQTTGPCRPSNAARRIWRLPISSPIRGLCCLRTKIQRVSRSNDDNGARWFLNQPFSRFCVGRLLALEMTRQSHGEYSFSLIDCIEPQELLSLRGTSMWKAGLQEDKKPVLSTEQSVCADRRI